MTAFEGLGGDPGHVVLYRVGGGVGCREGVGYLNPFGGQVALLCLLLLCLLVRVFHCYCR